MRNTCRRPLRALRGTAAAGLLVVAAGCATIDGGAGGLDGTGTDPSPVEQVEADRADEDAPSALEDFDNDAFPDPLIPPDDVRKVLPPDRIPPIDEPQFVSVDAVTTLEDDDPVLSLTVGEETRAYPLQILTYHEIVNDTVDGTPVAVTYCPLCNSGVAFERTVDDRVLTFGTSGMLYADNLVMYDRQTESLWPQLTGQASIGVLTGTELTAIPMGVVGWDQFTSEHPDALVLSEETGHDRPYGQNPYVGYDDPDGRVLFPLPDDLDDRLRIKERVVGLGEGDDAVAVVRRALVDADPVTVEVDGQQVVVWHREGQFSALDGPVISRSKDVGTVAAYDATVDGKTLTFADEGTYFVDEETGSSWNVLGRAVRGPLKGTTLEPVQHLDTFWFSWVSFHPDSAILGAED